MEKSKEKSMLKILIILASTLCAIAGIVMLSINFYIVNKTKNKIITEEQAKELKEIQGEQKEIAWGSQIRSYVLHPYSLVKDNRSLYESNNPKDVLDGNLDDFIYAYLKSRIQEGSHEE